MHCILIVLELACMVIKWCHCYVKVTSSCHVTSQHIQEFLGAFLQTWKAVFNGEQEKESGGIKKISPKDHHLASLVIPNDDPWDKFFYPTLTLLIDSFNLACDLKQKLGKVKWLSIKCISLQNLFCTFLQWSELCVNGSFLPVTC